MEIQSATNKPAIKSELTYQTDDPEMKGSRPTFKTAKLLKLWQVIHLNKQVKYSWKNSHWWETIQLFKVWQEIQSSK